MMRFKRLLFSLPLILFSFLMTAQEQRQGKLRSEFQFHYSNDFFTATDYYYTQGVRMELALPVFRFIGKTHLFPKLKNGTDEAFLLSFNQQCFTPTSIREDIVLTNDRPFAGAIYLTAQRILVDTTTNLRLSSELQVGGVGPCSKCQETQENIHDWLNNVTPHGWQFQVNNAPVVNYTLALEKGIVNRSFINLSALGTVQAGTLYTNAQIGLAARLGWMNPYFNPWQTTKKFRCYIVATGRVLGVGYNATMQGGLFTQESIYTIANNQVERIVFRGDYGLEVAYRNLKVHYLFVDLSPEFKMGLAHRWGHCKIAVAF